METGLGETDEAKSKTGEIKLQSRFHRTQKKRSKPMIGNFPRGTLLAGLRPLQQGMTTLSSCSAGRVCSLAAASEFRRLALPRIQPVPHSCSSLQCLLPLCSLLHLFVTFLLRIVFPRSTGWPIPTQEGARTGQSVTE